MPRNEELIESIKRLKREKNAIILAHYYQVPEIQDLADFIGDSLALSQFATKVEQDIIVFCGVHFMAETAKILNPSKKVLLPDLLAGCSLADSAPEADFAEFKSQHPNHKIITYINSTAAVKALSDVICTSGNALQIVESFPKDQPLIFAPDKNLGGYINRVTERDMILWQGSCVVHDQLNTQLIIEQKQKHPDALVIAHPECNAPVLQLADYIGSTNGMIAFAKKSSATRFIVASETGIVHQMQKDALDKEFFVVPADESCSCNDCPFMKMNTLEKLYSTLLNETPEIVLEDELIQKAYQPIRRMLDISIEKGIIK